MNQSANASFRYVCRQCRRTLQRQIGAERRQFSSTRQLESRALPSFSPTSSPELDTLLSKIRMRYFLPHYLNDAQKKLVRSDRLRAQLENDPVFATLGDEEIRLEHIDFTKDIPARHAFLDVIKLLKESGTKKDWENLSSLLEGYHRGKTELDPEWLRVMIKAAADAGALNIVIQCLSRVCDNGLSLSIPAVRDEILLALRRQTEASEHPKRYVDALKKCEFIMVEMERDEHCGKRKISADDPRADPFVIATALEFAAKAVLNSQDGKTGLNKVEQYSTRLIAALAQQNTPLSSKAPWQIPSDVAKPHQIAKALNAINTLAEKYKAVNSALSLTKEARGNSWPEEEQAFAKYTQDGIKECLATAQETANKQRAAGFTLELPAIDI